MNMKKMVLGFMVVATVFSFGGSKSFAMMDTNVPLYVMRDTSEYEESNEMLREVGARILSRRALNSYMLSNVNRLVKSDSRWSSILMQSAGLPIGRYGCCLTSFTMAKNYIYGSKDTPADVNEDLGKYACGFDFEAAEKIVYKYTLIADDKNSRGLDTQESKKLIVGTIDVYEIPVIVGMQKDGGTGAGGSSHFVLAYGYTETGDIYIKDPAARNYTVLSQYLNNGYIIDTVYAYTK